MRDSSLSDPGAVRRWWWRGSQGRRLGTICVGTVIGLVVCGVLLSGLRRAPAPAAADPALPTTSWATSTGEVTSVSPTTPPADGDRLIAVTAVPSVHLLDGVDPATNEPVAVRVLGIRATPPCWADEARASAANLVEGKEIRLAAGEQQADSDGRVPARVSLSDGRDYAHAVVTMGAAQLDAVPDQGDLTAAEADARQAGRGLWSPACDATERGETDSSTPEDEQAADQGATAQQPPTPQEPPTTTTTEPPADDDVQRGVCMGAPCSPEGARGVTDKGQSVVCVGNAGSPPKWRKA